MKECVLLVEVVEESDKMYVLVMESILCYRWRRLHQYEFYMCVKDTVTRVRRIRHNRATHA